MTESVPHTPVPRESADDAAALRAHATELADAIADALPGWVVRSVVQRCEEAGVEVTDDLRRRAQDSGERCRAEIGPRVARLLDTDVDEQRSTPLAILRSAVRYPTELLSEAGVAAATRDEFEERAFPTDVYGLSPASFGDIDPALSEPGLVWGAAKAHVHLVRHRRGPDATSPTRG